MTARTPKVAKISTTYLLYRWAYDAAFAAAGQAARDAKLEPGRVERAIELVRSGESRPYNTTLHSCNCYDAQHYAWAPCKHVVAMQIETKVKRLLATARAAAGHGYDSYLTSANFAPVVLDSQVGNA